MVCNYGVFASNSLVIIEIWRDISVFQKGIQLVFKFLGLENLNFEFFSLCQSLKFWQRETNSLTNRIDKLDVGCLQHDKQNAKQQKLTKENKTVLFFGQFNFRFNKVND